MFKLAYFIGCRGFNPPCSASRRFSSEPPEPLERRPSPLPAFELSTGQGRSQVPRVAALMVVSAVTALALLSCGADSESIRATQTAFMATRAVEEAPTKRDDSWRQYDAKQDRLRELLTLRLKLSDPRINELHDAMVEIPGSFIKCQDGLCFLQLDMRVEGTKNWATATPKPMLEASDLHTPVRQDEDVTVRDATFLCYDVSATYRTFRELGHEEAMDHLQNFLNLETDGRPYIRPSDARNAWEACQP